MDPRFFRLLIVLQVLFIEHEYRQKKESKAFSNKGFDAF